MKEDLDFADSEESADSVDTADTTDSHRGCTHNGALVMRCSLGCMEDKRSRPCLDPWMVDKCVSWRRITMRHTAFVDLRSHDDRIRTSAKSSPMPRLIWGKHSCHVRMKRHHDRPTDLACSSSSSSPAFSIQPTSTCRHTRARSRQHLTSCHSHLCAPANMKSLSSPTPTQLARSKEHYAP